jgi:hypothetical protein
LQLSDFREKSFQARYDSKETVVYSTHQEPIAA